MKRICDAAKKQLTRDVRVYKRLLNEAVAAYNCILRGEVRYMVKIYHETHRPSGVTVVVHGDDLKEAIWKAIAKFHDECPVGKDMIGHKDFLFWFEGLIMVLLVPAKGQERNMCESIHLWRPHIVSGLKRLFPKKRRKT